MASRPLGERTRLVRNAASSYGARALLMLSVLLVTPYLFRRLGADGFGTWSVMLTLTAIFNLLEIGFADGIVRLVAALEADGRRGEVIRTIKAGMTIMAGWGLVALAVAAASAALLGGLAAETERDAFRAGMLVLGAAVLLRFPCVAWGAGLKGLQRYDLWNASFASTTVLAAIGAVLAVELQFGLLGLAVAQGVALVFGGALYGVSLARVDRSLVSAPALPRKDLRSQIIGVGSFTLAAESFLYIGQRMDVAIIAALRSAAVAAPYAAALKLQSGVQGLTMPFVDLLMPMASDLWTRGRRDVLLRRLTLATRVATQVTFPIAFGIALFSTDVVDVWLGSDAPDVTAAIVAAVMAVQVIGLSAAPARKVLIGVGRVRLIALLSMVEGVGSVVLTIVLVSAYGALGAALATLATVAVIAPLKLPLACRTLGYPVLAFLGRSIGAALASSAPSVAAMSVVWWLLEPGALRLFVGAVVGTAIWAAIAIVQIGVERIRGVVASRAGLVGFRVAPHESELGSPLPAESARAPQ